MCDSGNTVADTRDNAPAAGATRATVIARAPPLCRARLSCACPRTVAGSRDVLLRSEPNLGKKYFISWFVVRENLQNLWDLIICNIITTEERM